MKFYYYYSYRSANKHTTWHPAVNVYIVVEKPPERQIMFRTGPMGFPHGKWECITTTIPKHTGWKHSVHPKRFRNSEKKSLRHKKYPPAIILKKLFQSITNSIFTIIILSKFTGGQYWSKKKRSTTDLPVPWIRRLKPSPILPQMAFNSVPKKRWIYYWVYHIKNNVWSCKIFRGMI